MFRRKEKDRSGRPKLFGLGLSRTGTTSLTLALESMGLRIRHFPSDAATVRELTAGNVRLSILREVDGITDITTIPFYKQLDVAYPGSKFILTVRDYDSWIDSIERFLQRKPPEQELSKHADRPELIKFRRMLRERVYGSNEFDRDAMTRAYFEHHSDVDAYFKGRSDLLTLDIVGGERTSALSKFLGRPCESGRFPVANKRTD